MWGLKKKERKNEKLASFFDTIYEFLSDFKNFSPVNTARTVGTSLFVLSSSPYVVVDTSSFVAVVDAYSFPSSSSSSSS